VKVIKLVEAKGKSEKRKAAKKALKERGPVSNEKTVAKLRERMAIYEEILGVEAVE